jgi:hypothetical protein
MTKIQGVSGAAILEAVRQRFPCHGTFQIEALIKGIANDVMKVVRANPTPVPRSAVAETRDAGLAMAFDLVPTRISDRIKVLSGRTNADPLEGWTLDGGYSAVTYRSGAMVQCFGIDTGLEEYVQARIRAALATTTEGSVDV